jgi:hypothetical protein
VPADEATRLIEALSLEFTLSGARDRPGVSS